MTGQTLGHYQILEQLGAGGMGEVYKALDTRLNRTVAIKLLRADRVADADRKQRFIQEAQSASALNHPNIVVVYDINNHNGLDYMVMECVAGKTLDALIPRQGMRLAEALKVAIQMADALTKAHGAGIIHRDLKPSNVMVSDDGHVKLLDFGLAKLIETPIGEDDRTRTQRLETDEGTIMGTAAYMSPEQAEGRKLDVRSDIFSLGAVLYEMATGHRAFAGESRMSTLSAILKDEPKPTEGLPPDLEKIIRRCLRKDPSRRFQGMADVKVELEEVREDSASGRFAPASSEIRRGRTPRWIWAAGLVLLVLGGLGAWGLSNSKPKAVPAMRTTPLTTYLGSELSPTFSPDGRQVAFAWNGENRDNFDIYVKMVEGGDPLRLTRDPAPDIGPAWSPDGRFIAFVRGGAIYEISPLGGAERKITDARGDHVAWTPDGKSIAFNDESGAVVLLNRQTGERRKLTNPPAIGGGDASFDFSPDGRSLAFVRAPGGATGALYVMPLPDGPLKHIEIAGNFFYSVTWTPDGKDLVAVVERAGITALWRAPVQSGEPSRIAGLDDGARTPSVSATSHRLAYSRALADENIWSLTGTSTAPIISSTRRDFSPQFSPDASRISFSSDRTGGWEVYVCDAQGGHVVQLTSFGNLVADGAKWSPDGRELVFAVLEGANRDIYVVPSDGGTVRRMTTEPSEEGRPSYSRDGKWIYFRSNRSGKDELWKMPRSGGDATQVTQGGGFEGIETWDGKTLYFPRARTQPGLWSMPSAGGDAHPVAGLESVGQGRWAVTDDGVCYVEGRSLPVIAQPVKEQTIVCWNSTTHKTSRIGAVEKPIWNAPPAFSVSRDGRRFLWNQTDHQDADLVLVENFR